MTALVQRDDLSQRTVLSKSALTTFEFCGEKAWLELHHRLPLIPSEKITFGSCVDAAVEQIIVALRAGQTVEMERVMAAVEEVRLRDPEVDVNPDEVERAAMRFVSDVAPRYDFALCRTQPTITTEFEDLGPANGHPDVILKGPRVRDVKTAAKSKPETPTLELAWYGLLVEEEGEPVIDVGYWTWVRLQKPYWQIVEFPFTDELRRYARERAGSYVRAKKADEYLNRKTPEPKNYSFSSAATSPSLCKTCQYSPANGGPCVMALREEAA